MDFLTNYIVSGEGTIKDKVIVLAWFGKVTMEAQETLTKSQQQLLTIIKKRPGIYGTDIPRHLRGHLKTLELLDLIEYKIDHLGWYKK